MSRATSLELPKPQHGWTVVGLISDTHGLLRAEAVDALRGCRHVVHAGDIGGPTILEELGRIAPVTAVRGNNDRDSWANSLPLTAELTVGGVRIHVLHDIAQLGRGVVAAGIQVVVAGHSHKPREERRDGLLYLNPGSAGPRRFSLPVSLAKLHIAADLSLRVEFVTLV
ncbi:MAG TPA: metallophosphoesterase family protein [Burkholderiaceae bacterium]|nr:metallophosphoesterase family protein [Burkholderiaceae bacterium]